MSIKINNKLFELDSLSKWCKILLIICFLNLSILPSFAQEKITSRFDLEKQFRSPSASASPWVFWYWMHGAVSKEGIKADIHAMKDAGIGGAYLMPIKDTLSSSFFQPAVRQLSPDWWMMVRHAMNESKRIGIK